MNTDDLAARTIDAAKNVLRQQLEAQADQRAMAALVEKLAAQATIQQSVGGVEWAGRSVCRCCDG
ncbi:hypothetical protein [Burkholderia contaminans]|uniref:Uncharacterized protein n=1 Tax=Burkholderia contaminans TaxID=488447 RepID=A0A3N8PRW6_9BURK|nr:hypothetical protein [Burkholderia contaminans]RQT14341.1 hypothetical protein DF051_18740 [Burkholderia contaminans]